MSSYERARASHLVLIVISIMFVNAPSWTLVNTIDIYNTRGVVRGFLDIPDVHCDPLDTHAPVASDCSSTVLLHLTVRYKLILKQLDAK